MVTTNPQAAAWYRRAQRAADPRRAAMALRLAVTADPDFALAAADLEAITGTPGRHPGRRPMHPGPAGTSRLDQPDPQGPHPQGRVDEAPHPALHLAHRRPDPGPGHRLQRRRGPLPDQPVAHHDGPAAPAVRSGQRLDVRGHDRCGVIRHTAGAATTLALIIVGGLTVGQLLPAGWRQYFPGIATQAAVTVHRSAGLLSPDLALAVLGGYAAIALAAATLRASRSDA